MLNIKLIKNLTLSLLLLLLIIISQLFFSIAYVPTASMQPTIKADSLLVINNHPKIEVGKIYTYKKNNKLVVHRIIDTRQYKGTIQYQFKGDNNNKPDSQWVKATQIKGEVVCASFILGKLYKHISSIISIVCFCMGMYYIINVFYGKDEPKDYTTINPIDGQ